MSISTTPNTNPGSYVAACQARARNRYDDCAAAAAEVADDGELYDFHAAYVEGKLQKFDPNAGDYVQESDGYTTGLADEVREAINDDGSISIGEAAATPFAAGGIYGAYLGGTLALVTGQLEESSSSTQRRGISRSKAIGVTCKARYSNENTACKQEYNQDSRRDRAMAEIEQAVQELGSSQKIQAAASNLGDCMENYAKTQNELKTLLDNFISAMPNAENFGFSVDSPAHWGNGIEKGNYNSGWKNPDGGGEPYDSHEIMKGWAGSGGEWYATLNPGARRPAGIPQYSEETGKLYLYDQLGSGEELDKNQYPVGWATILSTMIGQTERILEKVVSEAEALSIKNNPAGPQAKGIIAAYIVPRATETNSERAEEDVDGAYHTIKTDGANPLFVHNIVANGGGYFHPAPASEEGATPYAGNVPEGVDMSQTTPQALCEVCKIAADKLKGIGVIPNKQGLFLEANLNSICPLLDQIAADVACIVENFEDILEEEEKVDDIAADIADKYGLPEDDDVVQDAMQALAEEGITSDYFNRERVIFKEQCWLLSYVDSITSYKKHVLDNPVKVTDTVMVEKSAHKRLPYITTSDKYTSDTSKSRNSSNSNNATLLVDGDPYGFLNQLVVPPSIHSLLDMQSHEISALQPRIRLFKVEYDSNGDDAFEYELPFESHFTGLQENSIGVKQFLKRGTRGVGVGIKSFNFVYDGTNPFSVKKSISANLKIFANNMNELLQERVAPASNGGFSVFRYTDLAMKTGKSVQENNTSVCTDLNKENTVRAPLNFRLKANVGWAKPLTQGVLSRNVYNALNDSYVTLNLTPTVHNFEIDEQGRVVLNINYLAYIDEFFDQSMFNIFANADMFNSELGGNMLVATSRHIRDMRVETISKTCGQDEREDRIEKDMELLELETSNSLSYLLTSLIERDKVYYVNLPFEKIRKFNQFGPFHEYDEVAKNIFNPDDATNSIILNSQANDESAAADISSALRHFENAYSETDPDQRERFTKNITSALVGMNPNLNSLSFFYLSDLIDIILANIDDELEKLPKELNERFIGPNKTLDPRELFIKEGQIYEKENIFKRTQKNFQTMRVVLGPAELYTRRSRENIRNRLSVFVNLGDMPISVKYFMEFLTDKMLASSKSTYSLTTFLNDLLNNLVRDFLNNDKCFGTSIKQRTRINQTAVTAFGATEADGNIAVDPITSAILAQNIRKYPTTDLDNAFADRRIHRNHLPQPVLDVSGPPGSHISTIGTKNEFNCFVYFAARTQPTELMKGKKFQWTDNDNVVHSGDHERGIFHYLLGRDRGLIKNIKLSKTETKGLAEARFETNGYDGLEQLRVVYDVEVDMYANVNAFPGSYIYIDPKGFAPNMPALSDERFDLTDLGIGGYYMIIRSEHEFGAGYANTKLTAKWVHSIEKALEVQECERLANSEGSGTSRRTTCKYFIDRKDAATDI